MKLREGFSKNLRKLRETSPKMSRERLAEILGVTATTVYRWEEMGAWPEPETIEKIAQHFGVKPSTILGMSEESDEKCEMLSQILGMLPGASEGDLKSVISLLSKSLQAKHKSARQA